MSVDVAKEDFLVEDLQFANPGDALGALVEQIVNGGHLELVEDGPKSCQGGVAVQLQEQLEERLEQAVMGGLVDARQSSRMVSRAGSPPLACTRCRRLR